jgi:DNA-binding SARP family transcriptional activator
MAILARAYIALGKYADAQSLLDEIYEFSLLHNAQTIIYLFWFTNAEMAYNQDKRSDCINYLREAITHGKQRGLTVGTRVPSHMYPLYEMALDNDIETEYIKTIIRKLSFVPALGINSDRWPFPIKLYTLGRVSLLLDDQEQSLSGKSAQRPLALLHCLIAYGGRKVSQEKIMEALWPDATGDKAAGNFRTTLHRLRHFLQHDEALIMEEGRLTLDSRYAWVDVWSLERRLTKLEKVLQTPDVSEQTITDESDAIFRLYQGPFLGREAQQSWLLPLQEKCRNRILKVMSQLGDYWQRQENMEQAIACYDKAIEIDPLLERFYQKLMQLYVSTGNRSEALATYQRCRKVLSSILEVTPSPEIVQCYKKIKDQ